MGTVCNPGTRHADFTAFGEADAGFTDSLADLLATRSDAVVAEYVTGKAGAPYAVLRDELAAQIGRCEVHPVFFGSAITGAGTQALTAGVEQLLPAAAGDPAAPLAGSVFKIERGPAGEKIADARIFAGTLRCSGRRPPLGTGDSHVHAAAQQLQRRHPQEPRGPPVAFAPLFAGSRSTTKRDKNEADAELKAASGKAHATDGVKVPVLKWPDQAPHHGLPRRAGSRPGSVQMPASRSLSVPLVSVLGSFLRLSPIGSLSSLACISRVRGIRRLGAGLSLLTHWPSLRVSGPSLTASV